MFHTSGRWRRKVAGSVLASALLGSASLEGQEVSGQLRVAAPARSSAGVLVVATRVSDGALVGRVLTGARGEFRLAVTSDSLHIRALRVGRAPVMLARVQLDAGETHRVEMELPDVPVTLAASRTTEIDRCRVKTSGSDVVAELFSAARTALLATDAATPDGPPRAAFRVLGEQLDARGARIDSLRFVEVKVAASFQPFRSVPVDSLLAGGWVVDEADGGAMFRALDADVLLDDRFLSRYCLQLARDSAGLPDLIGVQFRPVMPREGRADIEGVLWLDRQDLGLRALTFQYTGLDAVSASIAPGGVIKYSSLPTGMWFVSDWSLRLPIVARRFEIRPGTGVNREPQVSQRRSLIGRRELRGEVLWVATGTRTQWVRPSVMSGEAVSQGAVVAREREDAQLKSQPCRLYGQLIDTAGMPVVHARLEVLDQDRGDDGEAQRLLDLARSDSSGRFQLCPSVTDRAMLLRIHTELALVDSVAIGALGTEEPHGIALMLSREGLTTSAVRGDVSPAFESFAVGWRAQRTGNGEVSSTPTPLSIPEQRRSAADPTAGSLRDGENAELKQKETSVAWLTVLDRDSVSIPFASVSVDGGQTLLTGRDGRVRLPRNVKSPFDVQVRRIGYTPFHGSITQRASDGAYHVQLFPSAERLAEVTVVAPRVTMLSRTGFYDRAERVRRGAHLGAFLTPEDVERRPFGSAANLIAGMQYVWMNPNGSPGGRGGCTHQVLVDGSPATIPLRLIPASEVMAIEVYPSTANAPVELIPLTNRGSCGIVAIWLGPRR